MGSVSSWNKRALLVGREVAQGGVAPASRLDCRVYQKRRLALHGFGRVALGALQLLAHGGGYGRLGCLVERDDGAFQRVRRVRPLPRRLQRVARQRAPHRDANRARARLHRRHRTPHRAHQTVAQPLGIIRQAQRVAQQHLKQRCRILRAEKVVEQSRVEAHFLRAEIRLRERLAKQRVRVELTKRRRREPQATHRGAHSAWHAKFATGGRVPVGLGAALSRKKHSCRTTVI
jgi:hypothetical protein